jgi:hypothetical protein
MAQHGIFQLTVYFIARLTVFFDFGVVVLARKSCVRRVRVFEKRKEGERGVTGKGGNNKNVKNRENEN